MSSIYTPELFYRWTELDCDWYLSFLVVGVGPVGDAVARQDAPPPVPGTETTDVLKHGLQHDQDVR